MQTTLKHEAITIMTDHVVPVIMSSDATLNVRIVEHVEWNTKEGVASTDNNIHSNYQYYNNVESTS